MPVHEVKPGEHLSGIARQKGFTQIDPIWNDGANADLKSKRGNPQVLNPTDKVTIPEKKPKTETRSDGQTYRFQLLGKPLHLRLLFKDETDQPLQNADCKLNVQGVAEETKTGADGTLDRSIDPLAKEAMVDINGVQVPIQIGQLDPVDTVSGQEARLNNLGYDAGTSGDAADPKFKSAVEEFQCDFGIKPVNGVCNAATQAKLKEVHGC